MPAPAWEDLGAFLSLDDFASSATFTLAAGGALVVAGIFDDPVVNASTGEYDMAVMQPRFTCRAADVADVRKNDQATIGGVSYWVDHDPHQDGTGMAVVMLSLNTDG